MVNFSIIFKFQNFTGHTVVGVIYVDYKYNTDPCGTPLITSLHYEKHPLSTTRFFLFDNQSSVHFSTLPAIPCAANFINNRLCGTLSNAFWKSK